MIGGSGFLGQKLIRAVSSGREWAVRSLDRAAFPDRPAQLQEVQGDATDARVLANAMGNVDAVWIRAAALGGPRSGDVAHAMEYCNQNVQLVHGVLEACRAGGCQQVFLDSSEQVFGERGDVQFQDPACEATPANFYGATKLIAEKMVRLWSHQDPQRSAQILRYSRVREAATRDVIFHMAQAARQGQPIRIFGNSARRISFVHVSDVIAANLAVLMRRPRFGLYHVSADRPVSLYELACRVRDRANRPVPIEVVDKDEPFAWEPMVVGMEWESSRRQLGLSVPKSVEWMIQETLAT